MIATLTLLFLKTAFAGACCGGGASSSALMTGDDRLQMGLSIGHREVHSQALPSGDWVKRNDHELVREIGLQYALLLSESWQIHSSISAYDRSQESPNQSDLSRIGDLKIGLGYEAWPELEYTPFTPKGFLTFNITLPTGAAVEDLGPNEQWASTGKGTPVLGFGVQLLKQRKKFDFSFGSEIKRTLAKDLKVQDESLRYEGSWGNSTSLSVGYSVRNLRFGTSLSLDHEEARLSSSQTFAGSSYQRWTSLGLSIAYTGFENQSFSMSWSDQTLFGAPANSNLSRTLGIAYQVRTPK